MLRQAVNGLWPQLCPTLQWRKAWYLQIWLDFRIHKAMISCKISRSINSLLTHLGFIFGGANLKQLTWPCPLGCHAFHYAMISSAYAASQMISSPILGMLSERLGRRPILLSGLAATAVVPLRATTLRDVIPGKLQNLFCLYICCFCTRHETNFPVYCWSLKFHEMDLMFSWMLLIDLFWHIVTLCLA